MTRNEIRGLLEKFDELPKIKKETTYLEICRYPNRRFEEICSRLLCFYFSPKKEHGFGNLFLISLLKLLPKSENIPFDGNSVSVIDEENAEGKRIDILIRCPNFVIGIENKITANVYNPLHTYGKRIDLYHSEKDKVFKVILSLKKIEGDELGKANQNGFKCITYKEFFDVIKIDIGSYLLQAKNKYLIYLTDFIQTLENMDKKSALGNEVAEFFSVNAGKVDNLVEMYSQYKEEMLTRQKQRIANLLLKIQERTNEKSKAWWIWEGYLLVYNVSDSLNHRIGIESQYYTQDGNALGLFKIKITTWNLNDWAFYEPQLRNFESFKGFIEEVNKRVIYIDTIDGDDEQRILDALNTLFHQINEIVKSKAIQS